MRAQTALSFANLCATLLPASNRCINPILPANQTLRQQIFEAAHTEFHTLPLKTDLYARFPSWKLNNARMALYRVYRERADVFARVLYRVR